MVNPFTPQAPQDTPRGQWVDGGEDFDWLKTVSFKPNIKIHFDNDNSGLFY